MTRTLAVTLLLCLASLNAYADLDPQLEVDEELRISAGVRARITKRLRATLTHEVRFNEQFARFAKTFPEISASYRFKKVFRVHGGYRWTADVRDEGDFRFENRFFVGARLRHDFGPVEVQYRIELQEDRYTRGDEKEADHVLRNRLLLKLETWDIFVPETSVEILRDFGSDAGVGFRDIRGRIGGEFDLKKHAITLHYQLQRTLREPSELQHIVGVGYLFKFRL